MDYLRQACTRRSALGWAPEGPQFTLLVYSLRAIFRTPADWTGAPGCCFPAHTGLRHSWHRLGIHIATIVGSQVTASRGCKVHFMLRPEGIASPAPTKAFTFELSPPKSPPRDVEYHYAGKSANSRDRTFTGKTKQHYGLQAKTRRRKEW